MTAGGPGPGGGTGEETGTGGTGLGAGAGAAWGRGVGAGAGEGSGQEVGAAVGLGVGAGVDGGGGQGIAAAVGAGGRHRQHLGMRRLPAAGPRRYAATVERLAAAGWERMSPVFAVPATEAARTYRGLRVPEQVRFATRRVLTSRLGSREFTLRTATLDFDLVTGARLQHGGLDQLLYSIGDALVGDTVVPDVLLADGWARARTFHHEAILETLHAFFGQVEFTLQRAGDNLTRFRALARGPLADH